MRTILAAVTMLFVALPAAAQQHGDHQTGQQAGHQAGHEHHPGGQFPEGWHGRVDRENQQLSDVRFMAMGSTFHIITGPHVILWNPATTATGEYRASATFRLDRAPERREGFGIFVGGQDLDAPNQDYLYFLARHDGSYMIRHRAGAEVHTLADWTKHTAINRPGADSPAANQLVIDSRAGEVRFVINGEVVQTLQRVPMLNTDGIVGLRVGHHLDVHVPEFGVTPAGR